MNLTAGEIAAQAVLAKVFPTDKSLQKYLQEHPGADKSNHSVKDTDSAPAKEDKPDGKKPSEDKKEPAGRRRQAQGRPCQGR